MAPVSGCPAASQEGLDAADCHHSPRALGGGGVTSSRAAAPVPPARSCGLFVPGGGPCLGPATLPGRLRQNQLTPLFLLKPKIKDALRSTKSDNHANLKQTQPAASCQSLICTDKTTLDSEADRGWGAGPRSGPTGTGGPGGGLHLLSQTLPSRPPETLRLRHKLHPRDPHSPSLTGG